MIVTSPIRTARRDMARPSGSSGRTSALLKAGLLASVALAALSSTARAQVAPPGAVIDLNSETPVTPNTYTHYSATVTPQTTGSYYVLFAFREDPDYFSFDDASFHATGTHNNQLVNPGFENGSTPSPTENYLNLPVGWGTVYQIGSPPPAAGTVNTDNPHSGSYAWYDGSVGSFDGIFQVVNVTAGQQYTLSFWLTSPSAFSTSAIEAAAYFGACDTSQGDCLTSLGNGFVVQRPSSPSFNTTDGDISASVFSLGSAAAQAQMLLFDGGTLRLTGGSFPGNVIAAPVVISTNNGTIDTSTGDGGFSGTVSGPGSLTIGGHGTFTLSGFNTYMGGTTLDATLVVTNGSALGTGTLAMLPGSTLRGDGSFTLPNAITLAGDPTFEVTADNVVTIGGPIADAGGEAPAGQLEKTGSGTLDLTGINTYSGATMVRAGTLLVDGSVANSAVTVGSGATLGGSGTLGSLVVQNGAVVAPGHASAFGTLSVNGDATFQSGSTFRVTVNGDGQTDRLAVGGVANLTGGGAHLTVLAGAPEFTASTTYRLLTAQGGVRGTFGDVSIDSSLAFLNPFLLYNPSDITLAFARNSTGFQTYSNTPNQGAVARAIEGLGPNSPLYNALLVQDPDGARRAFETTSGVAHASTTSAVTTTSHTLTNVIFDRLWSTGDSNQDARQLLDKLAPDMPSLVRCYGELPAPSTTPKPTGYTAWGEALGDFGHTDGGANAGTLDRSLGGFVLGIDAPVVGVLGDAWRVGVAGGYTNDSFQSKPDGASGTVEGVFGSLYGGARYGAVDIRLGSTFSGNSNNTRRTVSFPGFLESEHSSNDGYSVQGFGEIGYRFQANRGVLEPVAGFSVIHVHQDGFTETGGSAALIGRAQDDDIETSTLGVRGEIAPINAVPLVAHGFLGWQHAFGDLSPASVLAFKAAPANLFSVTGTPIDQDAVVTQVSLDWRATAAVTLGLSYAGQYGTRAEDNSVKGRLEYQF